MNLSYQIQRLFGRDFLVNLSYRAYRKGIIVGSPMRGLETARNHRVMQGEYIRASSLELVSREIIGNKVPGSVAELGVYRGEFARLINIAFSDRSLYLLDTFEGFDKEHVDDDLNRGPDPTRKIKKGLFSDTSVETVLSRMEHRGKCIIVPGVFPESAKPCEGQRFAFVSLDCDLYKPLYDGLRFFWPRLSPGGYIFVHDYNNLTYPGARNAVRQFASEEKLSYFPMSDACGSAVFAKPLDAPS